MTHKYQALRDATQDLDGCGDLSDDEFFAMLDDITEADDTVTTPEDMDSIAKLSEAYKDDPRWKAFIEKVGNGPDFSSDLSPREQFDQLVAALPKDEQAAGKALEENILG